MPNAVLLSFLTFTDHDSVILLHEIQEHGAASCEASIHVENELTEEKLGLKNFGL